MGVVTTKLFNMSGSFCCKLTSSGLVRQVLSFSRIGIVRRKYCTKDPKRFYKNVSITVAEGGGYEVNLDQRKLRTPSGTLFKVPNEALATAVAQEWISQKDTIKRHNMLMTLLCNTAIDNPTQRDKGTVADGMLEFLETDTVCFQLDEPPELAELQSIEWDPLLHWIQERYDVKIKATKGIAMPDIPIETMHTFKQHLISYNSWALAGYQQAVEAVKSFVIATALIDSFIGVEKAIALSRLETEFRVAKWGNVEEHHDMELLGLRARLASAVLFVHLNSQDLVIKDRVQRSR